MGASLSWLQDNWFTLVQSIGIIGSLGLTAETVRRDMRSRKIGDILTLSGHHFELWRDLAHSPELSRVLATEVDLVARPISTAEEEFLNLVFVHFQTGWVVAREGALLTLETLSTDVRSFFCLPLPRVVWEKTKMFRETAFVEFVSRSLKT